MPFTGFLDILCEYFDVSFQVLPMWIWHLRSPRKNINDGVVQSRM
jgi:hypothetical protein